MKRSIGEVLVGDGAAKYRELLGAPIETSLSRQRTYEFWRPKRQLTQEELNDLRQVVLRSGCPWAETVRVVQGRESAGCPGVVIIEMRPPEELVADEYETDEDHNVLARAVKPVSKVTRWHVNRFLDALLWSEMPDVFVVDLEGLTREQQEALEMMVQWFISRMLSKPVTESAKEVSDRTFSGVKKIVTEFAKMFNSGLLDELSWDEDGSPEEEGIDEE